MVISKPLTDLSLEKNKLLSLVGRKIAASKWTRLNEDFDSNLKVDPNTIGLLLDAIEAKIRKAEILYHSYFEAVEHAILCGNSSTLPIAIQMEFIYGTASIKTDVIIDDKNMYKETIDMQFQHFILLTASFFENIVRLTEILVKKVIVHQPGDKYRPMSTPLLNYKQYFDSLIKLGYRKSDNLSGCLTSHSAFLTKYLLIINGLRNSFIHGFDSRLSDDGYSYRVTNRFDPVNFSITSPELNIDEFTKTILVNSKLFYKDLLAALFSHLRHHSKSIPC